jgi:hypothetical protein
MQDLKSKASSKNPMLLAQFLGKQKAYSDPNLTYANCKKPVASAESKLTYTAKTIAPLEQ